MPAIAPAILDIAVRSQCNIFVESGTYKGTSLRKAVESGIFEQCYSAEIVPELHHKQKKRFAKYDNCHLLLGSSIDVFVEHIFPICTATDRIFFWLDGHFSAGITGGESTFCPVLEEMNVIQRHCPTSSIVIAIDDTDDLGRHDPNVPGLNWPTRNEIDAIAYQINANFQLLDFTGSGTNEKIARGVLVYAYPEVSRSGVQVMTNRIKSDGIVQALRALWPKSQSDSRS